MAKYSVLIAEDEAVERALLEDMVKSGFPGLGKVYTALNGVEALSLARKVRPDIILADISMPGLTGLDLMERLSRDGYQGKFLFTTAYDYSSYIRQALNMGAQGYLLKPIQEEELKEGLEKCIKALGEERAAEGLESVCSYAENYLLRDLLQGNVQEAAISGACSFPPDGDLSARLVLVRFFHLLSKDEEEAALESSRKLFSSFYRLLSGFVKNELILILEPKEKMAEGWLDLSVWVFIRAFVSGLSEDIKPEGAGATGICHSYLDLREGYLSLRLLKGTAMDFHPSFGKGFYQEKERKARIKKAVWGLRDGKPGKITGSFHSCFSDDRNSYEALYMAMQALLEYSPGLDLSRLFLSLDLGNIQGSLEKWVRENAHPGKGEGSRLIEEVLNLMRTEYSMPGLSQSQMAERFGLNPAYFSRLFKKETGKNFMTMLTEMRMERAKELLMEGASLEEASRLSGYSGRQYFQEAFRNYTGQSVAEYLGREG